MQSVFLIPPDSLEHIPENYFAPLDLETVFAGAPQGRLQVDIGCGDGAFLVEAARRNPCDRFLGVERLLGRVRKTCRRLARVGTGAGAGNARLIRVESHYLVRYLLPKESVSIMHIMFPDPWPKRKHHHNRLIQTDFLDAVQGALADGGELRLTTDNEPYFQHMREVFSVHPGFAEEPWEPGEDYPQTDFERHFRGLGMPIYRALLRKK